MNTNFCTLFFIDEQKCLPIQFKYLYETHLYREYGVVLIADVYKTLSVFVNEFNYTFI